MTDSARRDTAVPPATVRIVADSAAVKQKAKKPKKDTLDLSRVQPAWKRILNDTLEIRGGVLPIVRQEQLIDTLALARQRQKEAEKAKKKQPGPETALAKERSSIFRDTLSLSKVTGLSVVLPGFSQLYNKQYWKIPVLYAGVAGFTWLGLNANKHFKTWRDGYDKAVYDKLPQEVIFARQRKMNDYKTRRTVFLAGALATYLYFLGDGAVNYKGYATPVKRATTLAMIFPGAGQVYNRSYWKLPIVYGGFATLAYVIDFNNRGYQRYKKAYQDMTDGDPNTIDEFNGKYAPENLRNTRNSFRRYRDLAIIYTAGFYLLTIVDAHVDAYLKRYDISDNLSMRVEPSLVERDVLTARAGGGGRNAVGMTLKLNF